MGGFGPLRHFGQHGRFPISADTAVFGRLDRFRPTPVGISKFSRGHCSFWLIQPFSSDTAVFVRHSWFFQWLPIGRDGCYGQDWSDTGPTWFARNKKVIQKGHGIKYFVLMGHARVEDNWKAPNTPIITIILQLWNWFLAYFSLQSKLVLFSPTSN